MGMFIHALEGAWLNHPFWRTKFLIKDETTLAKLRDSGVAECWIDIEQGSDVSLSVEPATPRAEPLPPPLFAGNVGATVPIAEELDRASQLCARSTATMREMFQEARMGDAVEPSACAPLVHDVVESINRNRDALVSLVRLKSADEYTYMHSVAVCALMVSLGRQLGFDEAQCHEAGMAGMLHDLGKAVMPQEVLNKPGKLTDAEFTVIKQHPLRGFEMLQASKAVSEPVMDVCHHHHERIDGNGYPDALPVDQISQLSRMGAICDVYDAVTSDRPYKDGWDPAYALAQMASWKGHFDAALFQSFVKSVGIYPTGSLVRMSSGLLAVVIEQNPAALTKPQVKTFFSTKAGLPLTPKILDLANPRCRDQIEARESPENWQFTHLNELWAGPLATR